MGEKEEEKIVAELRFFVQLNAEELKSYIDGVSCIVICNETPKKDDNLEKNFTYWVDETLVNKFGEVPKIFYK